MAADDVTHVTLYGLHVKDTQLYDQYRREMEPLLIREGGRFGYDFVVSKVLRSETEANMNRVFTMVFPSAQAKARFFEHADYLAVRAEYFDRGVSRVTQLAAFEIQGTRTIPSPGRSD